MARLLGEKRGGSLTSGALFAEVVVQSPLGRRGAATTSGAPRQRSDLRQTFHYAIPEHLRDTVLPGQLVWVPFGRQQLPGIVLALSASSPVELTKDILEVIDPRPVLTPYQLELMFWLSDYYLAPLHLVAWAMFPPGISWQAEIVVHLGEAATEAIPKGDQERLLLEALRERGPMSLPDLRDLLQARTWRSAIDRLVQKGWARKQLEILGPRVKPKTEAVVRMASGLTEQDLAVLSRSPRQRAVIDYLRRRAGEGGSAEPVVLTLGELETEAGVTRSVIDRLVERGLLVQSQREVRRDPLAGREFVTTTPPRFTQDQEAVWQRMAGVLETGQRRVFLLHGVTGSGKTEIYLRALARVLEQGGQGIVLVPEIALTPQTIRRFAARFPDLLAVLHSKLSAGERYDEWRRIREGRADVVIGPQSAIFAPLPRLRLIVLDEEHEWSYKHQEMPPYHARDVAIKLSELTGALVVLGSATPDLESYYRAQQGQYELLRLPQRIMGHQRSIDQQRQDRGRHLVEGTERAKAVGPGYEEARYMELPPIEVVDLRAELRAGNRSPFSRSLQRSMQVALAAGEQIILFLNRRGAATFVMCRDCGHVVKCRGCDVPLTYHTDPAHEMAGRSSTEHLICHHCSYQCSVPSVCPDCGSKRIKFFGIGTQKVEQLVRELFPRARLLRWDRDVTGGKDAHEQILTRFINHQADVLIGTQMIAKGLDLPLVTLVGVVSADTALRLPDFRASERTFQLLTQVAGRAGRSILGGKVIIQTYAPQHFCIQAASRHDYEGFYAQELEFRRQQGYPPFSRLVKLLFVNKSARRCEEEADKMRRILQRRMAATGLQRTDVIGPAPCFVARLRGKYRWQLVLRGPEPAALLKDLPMPLGWRVDVDPVSLL
jgi:primosomal protein N' (replication factor Y)